MSGDAASGVRIHRFDDAGTFLRAAADWLLDAQAENNLLLGIVDRLATGRHHYEPPVYLATVEDASGILGCAFRTPPFKFGLTRMPVKAVPGVVRAAAAVYDRLPGVLGPEPVAGAFAEGWGRFRGLESRLAMRQRIFRLDRLDPPDRPAPGRLRVVKAGEVERFASWVREFQMEAGVPARDPEGLVRSMIEESRLFVWEHEGEPRSIAGRTADTPNGVRIGPVYTPPAFRGRGYASSCVAAVSERVLAEGRFCCLFTDLGNPTSNAVYRRLGYRPVTDIHMYAFEE